MSDTTLHGDSHFAPASGQSDLRFRIGWICHALRVAAVLWIIWIVVLSVIYWSDKSQMLQNYGQLFAAEKVRGWRPYLAPARG